MSEETLRTIFAKNLCYYLESRGLNQADLCKHMGVSSATASDWCNAHKMPRAEKIQAIAIWLDVSVGDLMEGRVANPRYYLNEEAARAAQEIFKNKELKMLFDVQRGMSPEDLRALHSMALALKRKERENIDDGC